jgi:hypothetical protein
VSAVPRHSEEELRQQWAFLDALVDRQAASLKSGNQDPEEEDLPVAPIAADGHYLEEISTLTRRVTTLESERITLLRRIDLAEEARMAAETARATADAARASAEHALAEAVAATVAPVQEAPVAKPAPVAAPTPTSTTHATPSVPQRVTPVRKAPTAKSRRRSWWQRFKE